MNAIEKLIEYALNEDLGDGGYSAELASEAVTDLARLQQEHDAALSDLQDAVDFVYNIYGKNDTLAAITTAHWRAIIKDAK
jgi:hypothetical protein